MIPNQQMQLFAKPTEQLEGLKLPKFTRDAAWLYYRYTQNPKSCFGSWGSMDDDDRPTRTRVTFDNYENAFKYVDQQIAIDNIFDDHDDAKTMRQISSYH